MKSERPEATLFMLVSVDGKISTGDNDERDADKDFPKVNGVKDGLYQYYELEKRTDFHSLNTGRVMEKIGVNTRTIEPTKSSASFISGSLLSKPPHLCGG